MAANLLVTKWWAFFTFDILNQILNAFLVESMHASQFRNRFINIDVFIAFIASQGLQLNSSSLIAELADALNKL